jgi:hypothetical protein
LSISSSDLSRYSLEERRAMTTIYADLSQHDWDRTKGELNFPKIKAATSGAICLRATYGDPTGVCYPTLHFGDMTKAAKSAGFTLLGAYHNLVKGDAASIARQVDWLRSEMDKYGSTWAMLDIERYQELVANNYWPRWDDVQQFAARWAKVEPNRVLAHYLPPWLWRDWLGKPDLRTLPGPLVSSQYGANPSGLSPKALYVRQGGDTSSLWMQYGGRSPDILQYGSNSLCPGASGNTDVNAFRGTFAELSKLLTKDSALQPTGDDMEQSEKLVEDTGYAGRSVGDHFADTQNWRNWEFSADGAAPGVGAPGPDTRIAKLHANAAKAAGLEAKLDMILAALGTNDDEQTIINGVLTGLATKPAEESAAVLRAVLSEEQIVALVAALAPSTPAA